MKQIKITKETLKKYCKLHMSNRDIANKFECSEKTIRNYIKSYNIKTTVHRAGRKKAISKRIGDKMCKKFAKSEYMSARNGINFIKDVTGREVSKQTIIRELSKRNLKCRVRQKKPAITDSQLRKRKLFYEKHKKFTYQDFQNYIFTDESTYVVKGESKQKTFYSLKGVESPSKSYIRTLKFGGGSVMVWGYISILGVGKLHRVEGTVNTKEYIKILEDAFLDSISAQGLSINNYIFVQDNAPAHTSKETKKWLSEQNFKVLEWPPNSPDMNIIENVWGYLDRKVRERDVEITNKDTLFKILEEEWYKISPEYIRRLYKSMPRRIKALKKSNFQPTKY